MPETTETRSPSDGGRRDAQDGPDRRVVPALALAVLSISFAALFFRKAGATPPLVAAGLRLLLAAGLLWPILLRNRARGRLTPAVLRAGVLGGVFYGIHFGAWVTSLSLTSVAASVTLVTATPLLLGLFALLTGRDRPLRRHWVSLGLAAVGVTIIGGHDSGLSSGALLGDALALLGAAAMAGYLLVSRSLGPALDVGALAAIATLTGGLLLATAALATGESLLPPTAADLGWIALAALVPQLVGHTLLTWALRHTRPTVVGLATVGEPVGASLLGWLWLGEAVAPATLAGGAITLSAVVLALWEPRRQSPPQSAATGSRR